MVFAYPTTGLHVRQTWKYGLGEDMFHVQSRSYEEPQVSGSGSTHERDCFWKDGEAELWTVGMPQLLAPLLTCRQFYQEAMPTFYKVNHFRLCGIDTLYYFLSNIVPERRQYLTQLSVGDDWSGDDYESETAEQAFTTLSQVTHLQKLHLYLDEDFWLKRAKLKGRDLSATVSGIPEIQALGSIRGLHEVEFHACPTFEKLLKKNMLSPKPQVETSPKGQLGPRKAHGIGTRSLPETTKEMNEDGVETQDSQGSTMETNNEE